MPVPWYAGWAALDLVGSAARASSTEALVGLDLQYRAFAEESALLELAGMSEAHGEEIALLGRYLVPRRAAGPLARDDIHRAFTELGARMLEGHPGIASRRHSLGRSWDVLHYLLSPGRRAGESLADDWGTWAIRGSEPVGAFARGCQGAPIRYIPRGRVGEISHRLDGLRREHLRAHWEPATMEQMAVYKLWADREESFDAYWIALDGLRAFYRAVRRERESVLVVLD